MWFLYDFLHHDYLRCSHIRIFEVNMYSSVHDFVLKELRKKLTQEHDNQRFQEHGWNEAVLPYLELDLTNQNQQF